MLNRRRKKGRKEEKKRKERVSPSFLLCPHFCFLFFSFSFRDRSFVRLSLSLPTVPLVVVGHAFICLTLCRLPTPNRTYAALSMNEREWVSECECECEWVINKKKREQVSWSVSRAPLKNQFLDLVQNYLPSKINRYVYIIQTLSYLSYFVFRLLFSFASNMNIKPILYAIFVYFFFFIHIFVS